MANSKPTESSKLADNVPSPSAAVAISRHPEFCFDNTLVAIQVENTLFNIHKYQLLKSTTFSDMFAIADESQDEESPREGSSLDHPIVMQGVSASDFVCLMKVLYASHFSSHQPDPEAVLIIPAFRLASMWNFAELCAYLKPLAERVLGDVDKIVFAQEFGVAEWLVPAYAKLCLREEKITGQEAEKLGLSSLLFVSRFREDNPRKVDGTTARCSSCNFDTCYNCGNAFTVTAKPMPAEEEVKQSIQDWLDKGSMIVN
ncbi:hypothetical protein FRC07_006188 [Ceratobasidium sp. 392]|nr:hypothetical protein FRC07_006188 [Ceratobasidium sp. 392]